MIVDPSTRDYMESPLEQAPEERPLLTFSELAYLAGTTPEVIEQLLEWDMIVPAGPGVELFFPVETIFQVRKLLRIHVGLGIDFASLPLVLDLLDRVADLEQRLSESDPTY